ncbi:YaiI/YqxD family protein [Rossellomorea sp. BNER]|uniref:YaiI/YqxD family protein n=1 Tax=Rossellomorea sp. BNER TaxID=2962031 RepID=UPI003AF284F7|nr:YaiI/YqxD family protein [Rossellomorea sp. BNER]
MDADACPVKDEIVEIAKKFQVRVIFVASNAHRQNNPSRGEWVYVDASKEAADLYIMNHVKSGDIVVTQDIGLASLVLPKKVYAISHLGKEYNNETIVTSLDFRYLSAKERRKGNFGKGPKPFKQDDRERFIKKLTEILSNLAGN